ncbi:hypothetical protein GBF35_21290 [Nonomuraea phyllanthi]|nr:hypothetical protein GBF35_21290 [Nonomuraea phyllanthi]
MTDELGQMGRDEHLRVEPEHAHDDVLIAVPDLAVAAAIGKVVGASPAVRGQGSRPVVGVFVATRPASLGSYVCAVKKATARSTAGVT